MSQSAKYRAGIIMAFVLLVEVIFWVIAIGAWYGLTNYVPAFSFARSYVLWALLALPLIMLLYLASIAGKNRSLSRYADDRLLQTIVPDVSSTRSLIRYLSGRLGMALIIISLAGPRIGTRLEEVKTKGIDVMVALDVSNSMLTQDLKPNRLEVARRALQQLTDQLKGDRMGIVVFAGQAYTQLPITSDRSAAKLFINALDPSIIGTQGTRIGTAIRTSMKGFDMENGSSKTIIVITDGENHEDDAEVAATEAAELGISVHTIGMGSIQGGPIPITRRGQVMGFKKDKDGSTVVSKLNEPMLQGIAAAGNGVFIRATTLHTGIEPLIDELRGMDQTEMGSFRYAGHEDRFQFFLAPGCALMLLMLLMSERRTRMFGWMSASGVD